jgi:Putative auto-transporter adhesin, head GIN domain
MKRSQKALGSGIGVVIAVMFTYALLARFANPAATPSVSGARATKAYDFSGFAEVRATGQWDITVVSGNVWAVEVSYPAELERYLDVRMDGDHLVLRHRDQGIAWSDFGAHEDHEATAHIVMPALARAQLAGATALSFSGFEGAELKISGSGTSKIEGKDSRYRELELEMSGAGIVNLSRVPVTNARVKLSGTNNVTLQLHGGTLRGSVSGTSQLEYYGTVASQDIGVSGVASVRKIE